MKKVLLSLLVVAGISTCVTSAEARKYKKCSKPVISQLYTQGGHLLVRNYIVKHGCPRYYTVHKQWYPGKKRWVAIKPRYYYLGQKGVWLDRRYCPFGGCYFVRKNRYPHRH